MPTATTPSHHYRTRFLSSTQQSIPQMGQQNIQTAESRPSTPDNEDQAIIRRASAYTPFLNGRSTGLSAPNKSVYSQGRLKISDDLYKPTIPQHSRLKADAEPYRHGVVKYGGLTLNQDKAGQRRAGLKLKPCYKLHLKHRTTLHPAQTTPYRLAANPLYNLCRLRPTQEPHEKTHLLPPQL